MKKNDQNSTQQNDCCDNNSQDCCPPQSKEKKSSWKKMTAIIVMAFAFVLAISAGVKAGQANDDSNGCGSVSITDFEWMNTNEKVAFILLEGGDENQNADLKLKLEDIADDLKAANDSAAMFVLSNDEKHFTELADKCNVNSFPAIVTLGRGCKSSVINKDITDASLANAFIDASTPVGSCSKASTCCSKKKNH